MNRDLHFFFFFAFLFFVCQQCVGVSLSSFSVP